MVKKPFGTIFLLENKIILVSTKLINHIHNSMYLMENRTTIQISESLRKELRVLASQRDVSYQELLNDMVGVFRELDKEKTIISIPRKLSQKIKTNLEKTDFSSVSDYTTFILRQMLMESEENLSAGDEEKIKSKLKKLGYL